jgi:hypothetical protein
MLHLMWKVFCVFWRLHALSMKLQYTVYSNALYSRLGHAAHAQYPWTDYMLPWMKYVLLIEETMFNVRKCYEIDSIVSLTYFCTKISNWQNANLLTTKFAWSEPVIQK